MGAKQSGPTAGPAANGRTRAYSGSDLPSSTSSSNGSNVGRSAAGGVRYHGASGATSGTSQHIGARARTRTAGGSGTRPRSGINIPNSRGAYSSPESEGSSPEEAADMEHSRREHDGPRLLIGSLPAHLSPNLFGGFKCPVCSKFVSSDEMDLHLVLCLTKPRVTYNEDVLTKDAGECAICLEELVQGDTIARLPCLCIYHKGCIDEWFKGYRLSVYVRVAHPHSTVSDWTSRSSTRIFCSPDAHSHTGRHDRHDSSPWTATGRQVISVYQCLVVVKPSRRGVHTVSRAWTCKSISPQLPLYQFRAEPETGRQRTYVCTSSTGDIRTKAAVKTVLEAWQCERGQGKTRQHSCITTISVMLQFCARPCPANQMHASRFIFQLVNSYRAAYFPESCSVNEAGSSEDTSQGSYWTFIIIIIIIMFPIKNVGGKVRQIWP
ncbi:unnamed protein product [Pleuronectes platessa]|uniref:E3 ubiquitin-protein ligase ZNRF1 n=1 Tax=Pleuronectes platessa TaxID=8262 RepID=A0A9N7VBA5_PLEPL|nr:unnamed protein product [Pleuronectes platessa]